MAGVLGFEFVLCFLAVGGTKPAFDEYTNRNHYLTALEYGRISQIPFIVTVCLTKVSICFIVLRIKRTKWLSRSMYLIILGMVSINGAGFVVLLTQCRPMTFLWDSSLGRSCWPNYVLAILALA